MSCAKIKMHSSEDITKNSVRNALNFPKLLVQFKSSLEFVANHNTERAKSHSVFKKIMELGCCLSFFLKRKIKIKKKVDAKVNEFPTRNQAKSVDSKAAGAFVGALVFFFIIVVILVVVVF